LGALVTIDNLEKMAMPMVIEYETVGGVKGRRTLPVEVWQNADSWKVRLDTKEELKRVTIDPDRKFPDAVSQNNSWVK